MKLWRHRKRRSREGCEDLRDGARRARVGIAVLDLNDAGRRDAVRDRRRAWARNEHVEPAEDVARPGGRDSPEIGGRLAGDMARLAAAERDFADGFAERALVATRDDDPHAARGERERDGATDRAAAVDDERDAAIERSERFLVCHAAQHRGKRGIRMTTPNRDDDAAKRASADARARFAGKRAALAVYGTFSAVFVALCTWQLFAGVFGIGARPLVGAPDTSAVLAGHGCADDIRALRAALDRALASAVGAADPVAAQASYRAALAPEWNDEAAAASRCGREPHGTEAFAALLRLRRGQETTLRRQVAEMAPLRRDLGAYLP